MLEWELHEDEGRVKVKVDNSNWVTYDSSSRPFDNLTCEIKMETSGQKGGL